MTRSPMDVDLLNRYRYVVKEHYATRLHFDFRMEIAGFLMSWCIPKGPSLIAGVRQLAIRVEDHVLHRMFFQGVIPEGMRGAGVVKTWDCGFYELPKGTNLLQAEQTGIISFQLTGVELNGRFTLEHEHGVEWWLTKQEDRYADPHWKLKMRGRDTLIQKFRRRRPKNASPDQQELFDF